MSELTDMLRDPRLQGGQMSPVVGADRKYRYGAGKPRAERPVISPMENPWGALGQQLGNRATQKWGQKDLEGNVVSGQNMAGILANKLRGMF